MREIIITTFLTLDGVMQAPGGSDEDRASGFEHGGRQKPVSDDEVEAAIAGWYEEPVGMLLGRRTYEIFASYWPKSGCSEFRIACASRMGCMAAFMCTWCCGAVSR